MEDLEEVGYYLVGSDLYVERGRVRAVVHILQGL